MIIELTGPPSTVGGRSNERRLQLFMALLFARNAIGSRDVNAAMLLQALEITPASLKGTVRRVLAKATAHGLRHAIACEHPTTGPWWLAPACGLDLSIEHVGIPLSPQAALDWLLSDERSRASTPAISALPPIDQRDVLDLIEADHAFKQGKLPEARRAYQKILRRHPEAPAHIAALMRLAQISRRLEDYRSIPNQIRSLASHADRQLDPILRNRLMVAAKLSSCWYDYSFHHDYERVLEGLSAVAASCAQEAELHVEWLTLYGLTQRRLALVLFKGRESSRVSFLATAYDSIAALEKALTLSSVAGDPYQIEQCASNLGNILGLFADNRFGFEDRRAQLTRAIGHLRTSVAVCDLYDLGRDSAYNAAFLMSVIRRYQLSKFDVDIWKKAGWQQLADGVARYGDAEFDRIRAGTAGLGVEQLLALAMDICAAALEDADIALFEKYAAEVALLSHDLGRRCPPKIRNLSKDLRSRALTLGRTTSRWTQAFREFRDLWSDALDEV